ncbi:MAG: sensor histidine kinase [Chitinophagaceae bacterium]|nr:sensor histidine kinase [Chitinophagaceae bacterium]
MGDEIFYIVIIASLMFFLLSFFTVYLAIFNNKRKSLFKQQLLQTQIEIQEQTLKTISEEIHDNVGQVLSLAKLNLGTIETSEKNRTKLADTKNLVSKAINDLRTLSRSLHGERIGDIGLEEAITNELKILQNTGQFDTELIITGQGYKLDPQTEMVLFRIVQEASHNAVKHAHSPILKLTMDYKPNIFTLTISDNGIGFEPEKLLNTQSGIGLKSMKSRAALIGGIFSIHSSKNNGTSISIELPTLNIKP